jgi:type III secretion system YscD/HrpQ family protein
VIVVRITVPGSEDRFAEIGMGLVTVGSDFDCDLSLPDDGVAPEHLHIRVTAEGVFVELATEASARLLDRNGEKKLLLPGQPHPWYLGCSVSIGELTINLAGDELRPPPAEPTPLARLAAHMVSASRRSFLHAMIGVGALVTTGLFAAGVLDIYSVEASAPVSAPEATFPAPIPEGPTPDALQAHLQALGVEAASVSAVPGGLEAVIYVKTARERANLNVALNALPYRVDASIFVLDGIRSAVQTILATAQGDVGVVALEEGALTLSGLANDPVQRERVVSVIRSDVAGIRDIMFREPVQTPADDLAKDIAAVWTGQRPYIVLNDGRRIREGEPVTNQLSIRHIGSDGRISVELNGAILELSLQQ